MNPFAASQGGRPSSTLVPVIVAVAAVPAAPPDAFRDLGRPPSIPRHSVNIRPIRRVPRVPRASSLMRFGG